MKLLELTANNFKNIESVKIEFSEKFNCLLGNNGMGKSNLLDAIFYLSFCKSFSGLPDGKLIRKGEDFMMLKGRYLRRNMEEEVSAGITTTSRRKSFKRKGKEYRRLSDHIGTFPLVMVAPQDIDLVNGASDERRKFIDRIISQSDPAYLEALIRYNSALEQRNRMLRDHVADHSLFDAVEMQMELAVEVISPKRREWVEKFNPIFNNYYGRIACSTEEVSFSYLSTLSPQSDTLEHQLNNARRHDEIVGHTSVGIHRDDLDMIIHEMPLRRMASQGQTKTFVIAMRLAQYEFLAEATGLKPILLLDDIFDKLDANRVEKIVEIAGTDRFGQIFITDTNRDHLDSILATHGSFDNRLWNVVNGVFSPIKK